MEIRPEGVMALAGGKPLITVVDVFSHLLPALGARSLAPLLRTGDRRRSDREALAGT
jgi:hypothetical protein